MAASTRQLVELPAAVGQHLRGAWHALRNKSARAWAALSSLPADQRRTTLVALLFAASILCTLWSFHLNSRVMGDAALGVGIFAPEPDSPEMLEKLRLRWWSDALFLGAQAFAFAAVAAQCWDPVRVVLGRPKRRP